MRKFDPVHLSADRALDNKVSQTMLGHFNTCQRAAYLYREHGGGPGSHAMHRGSAVHAIQERATKACIVADEPMIPADVVKAIADEVLAEMHVPLEEHDAIREMSWRWANEVTFEPANIVACETMFVLDVAGWQARGKIDYATLTENGTAILVEDTKSSRSMVAYEDIARVRPDDGTLAAKQVQLVVYALLLAFGRPVRIEGDEEVIEPFGVAERVQRFDLHYVYPAIEDKEGKMGRRSTSLTRRELAEYLISLEGMVQRLAEAERTGDWPAVPGSHCSICTAPQECPIPVAFRDLAGSLETEEEAQAAACLLDRRSAQDKALRDEIKRFVAGMEGRALRFGRDQVWEFGLTESERIADKEAMFDAMDRAVQFGEPFERAAFVKTVKSTPFRQRRLSEDELAEAES